MFPLPWELNQQIVDYLHNDRASLLACCQVSKGGIPFSRRHLFHEVSIREFEDESPKWKQFQQVMRANTRIGDYVRVLHLRKVPYPWFRKSISYLFPSLREINFQDVDWINDFSNAQLPLVIRDRGVLKGVTRFVFNGAYWKWFTDVQIFLSFFPQCDYLVMNHIAIGVEELSFSTYRVPPFRTLSLGIGPKLPLLEWIMTSASSSLSRITSLTLHNIKPDEAQTIGGFLSLLGDNLYEFDFSFRLGPGIEAAAGERIPSICTRHRMSLINTRSDKLDLRSNTQLRSLAFDDWFLSRWFASAWSLPILKKLRSRVLTTIVFRFRGADIEMLPWGDVDTFLNKLPISSVKAVRFENRMPYSPAKEEEYLRDRLPGLVVNGALQYRAIPEYDLQNFPWRNLLDGEGLCVRSSLYWLVFSEA